MSESIGPGCVHLGVENIDHVGAIGKAGFGWQTMIVDENRKPVAKNEIGRLNRALAETGDVLAEENAMLKAENQLAEERVRIEQQNRLYDSIAQSVRPQLDRLSALLDALPEEEAAFEQAMKYRDKLKELEALRLRNG